jgi:hypothetical protein
MISLVSAVNNLQTGITHPDVVYFDNMISRYCLLKYSDNCLTKGLNRSDK